MIIVTSNGYEVMVDDEDYPFLSRWSWFAVRKGNTTYACRNHYSLGGRKERKSKRLYMHLEIVAAPSGSQVDHLDGNGLNNRRKNLRCASHEENQRNRGGPQTNNKCGVRGVYWHRQRMKWAASIRVNRKAISLGLHDTLAAAAEARKTAEAKYWSADDMTRVNKQSDAPAAAGAQGEELTCEECNGRGRVAVDRKVTHQLGTDWISIEECCEKCGGVGTPPADDNLPGMWERSDLIGGMTDATPSPTQAAVPVSERARELLAVEYERQGWRRVSDQIRNRVTNEWQDCAIRAISVALSSHRQAGDGQDG